MKAFGLLVSLISFAAQIRTSVSQSNGLTVQTAQGPVVGSFITPNVRQFLGIPYASVVRWQPPQPPSVRNSTFQATQFGASCFQDIGGINGEFLILIGQGNQTVTESEQCLSLNIWAPALNRTQNTSVMIYMYGGGYQFGTSNTSIYQGQFLVNNNDDVILVTINYRTNIFGFPGAPQLVSQTQSQNFGALDANAAIQWVFDNIASFGGDPNRITIFGQSAGSALAAAFTFANTNDTRVKGVIQQSGSLVGLPSPEFLSNFGGPFDPQAWNAAASAVGCGTNGDAAQFTCMQGTSASALKSVVTAAMQNISAPTFVAVQDNITFFTDFDARSAAGNFLKVPLMVGNDKNEGDVFVVAVETVDPGTPFFTSEMITLLEFSCPAGSTAFDRVKAGVPTYRYRYDAVFPDISSRPDLRAYHSSEVPIVFGTASLQTFGPPPSVAENQLSAFVQSAWVAFARNPSQGPISLGWPQYNPLTNTLAILGGSSNATGISFTNGVLYDVQCPLATTSVNAIFGLGSIL